jgi:hypothetical protein
MNYLIEESIIKLAEKFQLPERIVNIEELPWIPFTEIHSCHFKPLRFDLNTGTWIYLFKHKFIHNSPSLVSPTNINIPIMLFYVYN